MDDIRDRRSGCGTDHRDRRLPYFSDVHRRCILCFLWCIFSRKPMIEKEFEATLRNLFLNDHRAESTVELVLMLLTAFVLAAFERRNRALFRKEREQKEREKV